MPITPVGTTFTYHATAGEDPPLGSTLANVASISDSGDTYNIMEYAATSDSVATKLAGRKMPGTITVELYYDGEAGAFATVVDTLDTGTAHSFGITFSDESTFHGNGIISQTPSIEIGEDVVRCTLVIEKTAAWTLSDP